MRLAQHLAVLDARYTVLAPCRHVVGIHFVELIYLDARASVTLGTLRTVADTQCLCFVCLAGIDRFLNAVVKDESQGIALQNAVYNRHLFLAFILGIEVVTLILG